MTLFLDTEEYIGLLAPNAAARVLVHDPRIKPNMLSESSTVSPGEATFLSIKREEINHLDNPYSDCLRRWPEKFQLTNLTRNRWRKYSTEVCQRYCILNEMAEKCKFIDSYDNEIIMNDTYVQENTYSNATNIECRNNVYERFRNNLLGCDCRTACNSTEYIIHSSRSAWPSSAYVLYFASKILDDNSQIGKNSKAKIFMKNLISKESTTEELIQRKMAQNFVRLEIFYETFKFRKISESKAYDVMDLISDFGGNISLWLSWSVFALFEILIFILHCIEALYVKYQN